MSKDKCPCGVPVTRIDAGWDERGQVIATAVQCPVILERDALRKVAPVNYDELAARLLALLPAYPAGCFLEHNDHRNNYMDVDEYTSDDDDDDWVSPESRALAIETNEMWSIQWYPESPEGFCIKRAHSLAALFEWLAEHKQSEDTP